jgi:hypothetical protein
MRHSCVYHCPLLQLDVTNRTWGYKKDGALDVQFFSDWLPNKWMSSNAAGVGGWVWVWVWVL